MSFCLLRIKLKLSLDVGLKLINVTNIYSNDRSNWNNYSSCKDNMIVLMSIYKVSKAGMCGKVLGAFCPNYRHAIEYQQNWMSEALHFFSNLSPSWHLQNACQEELERKVEGWEGISLYLDAQILQSASFWWIFFVCLVPSQRVTNLQFSRTGFPV